MEILRLFLLFFRQKLRPAPLQAHFFEK